MDNEPPPDGDCPPNISDAQVLKENLRLAGIRALYAARRPECFTPWEDVRPHGHTLSQAVFALTHPTFRKSVSEFLADMDVGLFPERWPVMRDHFWRHILWRLRGSELIVRARRLPGGVVEELAADLFDDAVPDFETNRITCCGLDFASVRVFEPAQRVLAPPHEDHPDPEPPRRESKTSLAQAMEKDCFEWLIHEQGRMMSTPGITKPEWLKRARAQPGWSALHEAAFNRVFARAVQLHPEMRINGRPRKKPEEKPKG